MSGLLSLEDRSNGDWVHGPARVEIDLETAPILRERLAALAGDVTVDLADVSFVDSQMMSVLVSEHDAVAPREIDC